MIYIVLDSLPPSANQAYVNLPSGGRTLSKAAQAYKRSVIDHIVKNHAKETQQLRKDVTISCVVAYGFPNMYNKGWPKQAKHRFKMNDLTNRAKLLHDAIVEATSMDDSQICYDFSFKYESENPQTTVYIWNEEDEPHGRRLLAAFESIIRGPAQVQ